MAARRGLPGAALGVLLLALWGPAACRAEELNPIERTIQLLTQLQATVVRDGEMEGAAYRRYAEWCESTSMERKHEIKMAEREASKLNAAIQEATSEIDSSDAKIEQLTRLLFNNNEKLTQATEVRKKEKETFTTVEQELIQSMDMLDRAIAILQKEMQSHPASFMQTKAGSESIRKVLQGLTVVVEAAGLPTRGKKRLMELLQTEDNSQDGDEALGSPDAQAYTSHSANLIDVMEDLRDQAETQLRSSRKAEMNAEHNYALLKTALEDEATTANKELSDEKASKSSQAEAKAQAEGDLFVTQKQVNDAGEALQSTQQACMQTAADHEHSVAGRKEELKALNEAKSTIQSTMGAAASATYSFVQVASQSSSAARSSLQAAAKLSEQRAIMMVKRLAEKQHSEALGQLASRLLALTRYGEAGGSDPFAKVKSLIEDMINKMQQELSQETQMKQYCDREMNSTEDRQATLQDQVEGLKSRIDQLVAQSVDLKGQVQDLGTELSDLAKSQADMDKARADSHAVYLSGKADLQQGLDGTRSAIRVLRDYYASSEENSAALLQMQNGAAIAAEAEDKQPAPPQSFKKSSGAGAGIIGLLEVVESDIANNLAQTETEEDTAQTEYEKLTQENKVLKATKEQDVVYKNKEIKSVEKTVTELTSDHDSSSTELSAVNEYMTKIREQCIASPEAYLQRKARREAEIRGLEEALTLLTSSEETPAGGSFLQRRRR